MAKKIDVVIGKNGEINIEASGFTGNDCLAATKALEEALGVAGEHTRKGEQFITAQGLAAKAGGGR
jgi:hypothetical protein